MSPGRVPLLAVAAACLLALNSGCGSSEKPKPAKRTTPAPRNVDPVAAERISDVIARFEGAATASNCEPVKGLMHSYYGAISDVSCRAVQDQLGDVGNARGAAYKTGAVIDYQSGSGPRRVAILALDSDRRYHLALIEDVPDSTVGSQLGPTARANAATVVRSLRAGDCDAFLRLVYRETALGMGTSEQICRRVSDVPFRRELVANPAAQPVLLGGNAHVAFFKLRTAPTSYYTMVMFRPRDDSPAYLLANAYPAG
jgi:hypothetical protein